MKKIKSFEEFQKELSENQDLQKEFKENPVLAVNKFTQQNPLSTDKWIYRIIVIGLSFTIVSIIVGILWLIGSGKIDADHDVPTIITAIGSAAIGAIAGLLAPPPKQS